MLRNNVSEERNNRIQGLIIGGALGDCLGSPYELSLKEDEYSDVIKYTCKIRIPYQGIKKTAIGQFTDDTEMTLILARHIGKNKTYKKEEIILKYLEWANSRTPMLGKNTKALLKGIKTIKGYEKRYDKKFEDEDIDEWSQSNGSLMRCSVLSVLSDLKYAKKDCKITNPHPINIEANIIQVYACQLALEGCDKNKILFEIEKKAESNEMKKLFYDLNKDKDWKLSNQQKGDRFIGKGYVLNSLYASLLTFKRFAPDKVNDESSDVFPKAMRFIIDEHPNSDTDTNAAIGGSLLGCYLGYNILEKDKITSNNIKIIKKCDTDAGDIPRNPKYTLHDFDKLTKKLSAIN